jgi:hypothetical protein
MDVNYEQDRHVTASKYQKASSHFTIKPESLPEYLKADIITNNY